MEINRDTYRTIKQMNKKQMSEYLGRVWERGYKAGCERLQPKPQQTADAGHDAGDTPATESIE